MTSPRPTRPPPRASVPCSSAYRRGWRAWAALGNVWPRRNVHRVHARNLYATEGVAPTLLALQQRLCQSQTCMTAATLVKTAVDVFERHKGDTDAALQEMKDLRKPSSILRTASTCG